MQNTHDYLGLKSRRQATDAQWQRFRRDEGTDVRTVRKDILGSWRRSDSLARGCRAAPLLDADEINARWQQSPINLTARAMLKEVSQMALEGDMVAAVSDLQGRLLWTSGSQRMASVAENVNFVPGGCWSEGEAGTNAIGLSLSQRQSMTVFASEHYMPFVHDWVCYAAPIIHPDNAKLVGVLDISTTWDKHNPLAQAAVTGMAHSLARGLPVDENKAELEICLLRQQPTVRFRGQSLSLSPRQMEVLALLALNPDGFTLGSFHAALYDDERVSPNTLKSELSHLRGLLAGQIGSRPYRLQTTVWTDVVEVWDLLRKGEPDEAMALYHGPLLARSTSPELEQWRDCIEAAMGSALEDCRDIGTLLKQVDPSAGDLVRDRLAMLGKD